MRQIYAIAGLVISSLLPLTPGFSQISQGGKPRSFQKLVPVSDTEVPTVQMGTVDVATLRAEDADRRKMGKEFDRRFGYTFDVQLNPANSGVWTQLPNGDRVWRLIISSKGALSINLTFGKYRLPQGADLYIVGLEKQDIIGALTAFNNQPDGVLGTSLVRGDQTYLEYYEPAGAAFKGELEINKVTHGYRDLFKIMEFEDSGTCNRNVNCPEGAQWQDEKRAVARIIFNGDWCSGALINNVLQDGKPYFLTANHCYDTPLTAWVFAFNWEATGCTNPSAAPPINQTVTGATLISRNAKSDFCLLQLSSKPPASYKPYYAGWNNINKSPRKSVIIHHPSGDIKKITFDNDTSTSTGYGSTTNDHSHWTTANYESGTTEGGSSGSPQFDQDHYIIGQLHGGQASCTNNTYDRYGKLSMSWAEGTTPATRLKDWLDPNNTGTTKLSGFDPACVKIAPKLPWKRNLDTVAQALPSLWRVKNPNADSTFRLVTGGYEDVSGKAFCLVAENYNPAGRGDTLLLSPISTPRYKNLKITWKYAYRRKSVSVSDTMRLMASRDCGTTFRTLATWHGANLVTDTNTQVAGPFSPTDTLQWKTGQQVLDSTYNRGDNLVFAFGLKSGNAGTLWLDQFSLIGDTAKDKPAAAYAASRTVGCVGDQIQFSDSSGNNPTSWLWTFTGGTPATSTEQNPVVTYNAGGTFKVKLIATNDEGSDSLVSANMIQVYELGQATLPLIQPFGTAGSFPPPGYILANPEGDVTWTRFTTVNAPGSTGGSLMFDNYSTPNVTGTEDHLVFPTLTTSGLPHLTLKFKHAYRYFTPFGGGTVAPDTVTIGYTTQCGGSIRPLWKKGGVSLATAGSGSSIYTPQASHWVADTLQLDSLLIYPELSFVISNRFGFGNRVFFDDFVSDTVTITGIASIGSLPEIVPMPNPAESYVTLKGAAKGAYRITGIFNSLGQNVHDQVVTVENNGNLEVNLQALSSGVYTIRLHGKEQNRNLIILKN